jgi:NitT/TauT family transport system permease protein
MATTAPAARTGGRRLPRSTRTTSTGSWHVPAGSAMLAVFAVGIWWLGSTLSFVIPAPADTLSALGEALADDLYLIHLRSTAAAAGMALVTAVVAGLAIGLALGLLPRVSRGFEPFIVATNGVPKIVLYPVLLLMLGMGTASKVALGAIIGVFPVLMNVAAGIRDMPPVYRKLASSLQASRWQTFRHIIVPAIRRPAMTGIRLAVSLSTVGVVLAEMFATRFGLGRVILASHTSGQYPRMLATVLLLVVLAFISTMLLWRLERRMR